MAAQYIGSYVVINKGRFLDGPGASILKIKGRVGSSSRDLKTIPIGKGAYEVVLPLNPDIRLKKYIQRYLTDSYFRKEAFLNKRQVVEKIFEVNWKF